MLSVPAELEERAAEHAATGGGVRVRGGDGVGRGGAGGAAGGATAGVQGFTLTPC